MRAFAVMGTAQPLCAYRSEGLQVTREMTVSLLEADEGRLRGLSDSAAMVGAPDFFLTPEWVKYESELWRLRPHLIQVKRGETVLWTSLQYLTPKGRLRSPWGSLYAPVLFRRDLLTGRRSGREWLAAAGLAAARMRQLGLDNALNLPPHIYDGRPWAWAGFVMGDRYTYCVDFPWSTSLATPAVGKQVRKAERAGYECAVVTDVDGVWECIGATERRSGFSYRLDRLGLARAIEALGPSLILYLCHDANGDPASTRVVQFVPGGRAIDWLAGTRDDHRTSGATQLLFSYVFQDLAARGACGIDLGGANGQRIAAAKSDLGGALVASRTVQSPGIKTVLRFAYGRWKR